MTAANKGHIEVMKMLLDRNANIEAVDKVSQNVSMACTALSFILIIVVVIIMMMTIIIIILLQSLALFFILLLFSYYYYSHSVYLWFCHTISHNTLYYI